MVIMVSGIVRGRVRTTTEESRNMAAMSGIGDHAVLSSIWNQFAQISFFKKLKLHEPHRRVQFRFLKNSQV